jgi:hypothetical protein
LIFHSCSVPVYAVERNRINSICRLHLCPFSQTSIVCFPWTAQDLQHLGVHLFLRKENLFTCIVLAHMLCNGTGLTASTGCTCGFFSDRIYSTSGCTCFFFQKPMYGVKRNRINSIWRLHLYPFSQTSLVCFFYELDRIYST